MRIKLNVQSKVDKGLTIDQLKKVLFNSMLKMQEIATINCPVDKGRLKNSINLNPSIPGYANYILSDAVEYGAAVEFGTAPHIIRPNAMKALKFKSGGKNVFAKKINHPGTRAQPFFRPALDQVKGIWVARYFEKVLKKNK